MKLVMHTLDRQNPSYHNDPKFSDWQIWSKSVDPDQTDQGLHIFAVPSTSSGHMILW